MQLKAKTMKYHTIIRQESHKRLHLPVPDHSRKDVEVCLSFETLLSTISRHIKLARALGRIIVVSDISQKWCIRYPFQDF